MRAGEAEELAQLFNRRLQGDPACQIRFLPCFVYTICEAGGRFTHGSARPGVGEILVEEELEGKYTKWWVWW